MKTTAETYEYEFKRYLGDSHSSIVSGNSCDYKSTSQYELDAETNRLEAYYDFGCELLDSLSDDTKREIEAFYKTMPDSDVYRGGIIQVGLPNYLGLRNVKYNNEFYRGITILAPPWMKAFNQYVQARMVFFAKHLCNTLTDRYSLEGVEAAETYTTATNMWMVSVNRYKALGFRPVSFNQYSRDLSMWHEDRRWLTMKVSHNHKFGDKGNDELVCEIKIYGPDKIQG